MFGLVLIFPTLGLLALAVDRTSKAFVNIVPLFALAAGWGIFMWVTPWLTARTQYLQQPAARGPRTMELSSTGVHWRWDGGQADVEWKNFIRILESKNLFLLYTSPACFNIVPKRALTPEETTEFRDLFERHLSAASTSHWNRVDPRIWIFAAVVTAAAVLLVMAIRNIR